MNKISQKMYAALTRGGVPAESARRIAEATEFLGESTEESNERDNYDILVTAKALSSLVRRHKEITPIMPKMPEEVSTDMTRVSGAVKIDETVRPDKNAAKKKISKLFDAIRQMPTGLQSFFAYFIPGCLYFLIALLAVTVVGLIALSIGSVVAVTIAGILLFIIGLLYGVSQFSVFTGAAFFEIGLGLLGGGLAILLAVLLYNFLTRTLPFCLKEGTRQLKGLISDFKDFRGELKKKAKF